MTSRGAFGVLGVLLASGALAQTQGESAPGSAAPASAAPAASETPSLAAGGPQDTRPAPTADQLAALAIMEQEVRDAEVRAGEFRARIDGIVRREYRRRRSNLSETYERQIHEEERLQQEARLTAIRYFEEFLRRYPDDSNYTPDALFRLAELYFEDAYVQYLNATDSFQTEVAAREAAGIEELPPEPTKDYSRTIEMYRRLIRDWPQYRLIDGAYYLLGYCLNDTAREDESRDAWLALVCHNKHEYHEPAAEAAAPASDEPGATADPAAQTAAPALAERPSASLGGAEGDAGVEAPFVDPYQDCVPVREESKFIAETWLRIGEYHFDFDYSRNGLDLAISSYKRVLPLTDSPYYDKALYKLAWAFYRNDDYIESIQHFSTLVDFADRQRLETGRTGSELRAEAVQYLGISFAEEDWNADQVPDAETGIMRVQNATLMPQDRDWTREVYYKLGDIYYDQAKYPAAIEVYELALRRWPLAPEAPQIVAKIADAHSRNNEFEEAIAARGQLAEFGENSDWARQNVEHPEAIRAAEELAETALIDTAVHHHRTAQNLRREGLAGQDAELLRRAVSEYNLAAAAYREYIRRYPNNPNAYELNFNLADALFYSGQYAEAGQEYTNVRDSNLDDQYLADSAFMAVKSLEQLVEQEVEANRIQLRTEPPATTPGADGKPTVQAMPIPPMLVQLSAARDAFIQRVGQARDRDNRMPPFAYQSAQVFYRYGHWDEAKRRFTDIYAVACTSHESGFFAWNNLINMAGALEDLAEAERLARAQRDRPCMPPNATQEFIAQAEEEGSQILTAAQFRRAMEKFTEAERSNNQALYEEAAQMLVDAVSQVPRHEEAAKALNNAAVAYERVNRFESATRLYERIVNEYPDSEFVDNALFRTAFNSNRFFEFERAVESYRVLADSPRFAQSEHRQNAILNSAIILEGLQQYERAAGYYQRYSEASGPTQVEKAAAGFKVGDMHFRRRDFGAATRGYRAFLTRFGSMRDAESAFLVVKANWQIGECARESRQTRERTRALNDTIASFTNTGLQPGSEAAEFAAQSKFIIVETQLEGYEAMRISGGGATLKRSIEAMAKRARDLETDYGVVKGYRRPAWTVGAQFRIGYLYERLAKKLIEAPVPAEVRRLGPEAEEIYLQTIAENVTPMEERAQREYRVAVEAAREGAINNEWTRLALERLNAYLPEEFPLVRDGRSVMELDAVSAPPPQAEAP